MTIWSLEKADRKSEEGTPEQCKPGTTSLPSLPSPSGNESAVALQDWIEVIDGPLRDISDSSSWWWDAVKERAQERYKKWVASGPYERLALKPPTAEDLEKEVLEVEREDGRDDATSHVRSCQNGDGGEGDYQVTGGIAVSALHDVAAGWGEREGLHPAVPGLATQGSECE